MTLLLMLALAVTSFAETHRFQPTEFHNTFSGAHKPVLRINPGDHVITSTIDARGVDSAGVQRGQAGNPETGPFFIEGAGPGDTLVVHLLRLRPTAPLAGPHAVTLPPTQAFYDLKRCATETATWQIDKQKASPISIPAVQGMRIELPLRPMLGCIATAPANKAAIPRLRRTTGGNMNYSGMGVGATLMLPVLSPAPCYFWRRPRGRATAKLSAAPSRRQLDVNSQ
jgi:acetamidase/formamidase